MKNRLYNKNKRSMHRLAGLITVLSVPALLSMTASAQSGTDNLNVDVGDCIELETREQQLACYEQRVNEVLRARDNVPSANEPEASVGVVDLAEEAEPSRATRREARQAEREAERQQRETERRQREAAEAAVAAAAAAEAAVEAAARAAQAAQAVESEDSDFVPGQIVARITEFREVEPDAYFVYLDNGQIWRQNAPKRYNLRVGAEVRLRPSRFGPSYRLTDPEVGSFIQVRRVN